MSTAAPTQPIRHALNLPAGSVRALLAIGVLAYLWILAVSPGKDNRPLIYEERVAQSFIYLQVLMVLMLAHFFVAHGKTIGRQVSRRSPLGLPRGSVRFLLLGGYLGLAYFMYTQMQKEPFRIPDTGPVMLMLAILLTCFIFGHATTHVVLFLTRGRMPSWFQDIQAWVALMGLIVLGIIVIFRLVINPTLTLPIDLDTIETVLAGIVGFYFGARS